MASHIHWHGCKCRVERGKFDIRQVNLECPATWRLISSGYTIGVFQLEKKLGQDWARKIKPENMEELADLLSLLRPGCLESGMSQEYADIKSLKKKPTYIHPLLKPILEPTKSCLVYQEQAIRIAKDLAGFSLAQADNLRKAIGKKKPEEIAKLKVEFVNGCQKMGTVTKPDAEEIFGWIEKFQRYGFNKSHAVSYAMLAYQTAWMKCHFPSEFFTSYLTFSHWKSDEKDEVYRLVQEARLFGIEVLPPDIRLRNPTFKMIDQGIAFGLSSVRGVGITAIRKIVKDAEELQAQDTMRPARTSETHEEGKVEPEIKTIGALDTWFQFLRAVPELHRNVAEALVKSGACDCYGLSRSRMLAELEAVLGTNARDAEGKKIEIKGLTNKEREYFLANFEGRGGTAETLQHMSEQNEQTTDKPMGKMTKGELLTLLQSLSPEGADLSKLKRNEIVAQLRERGYTTTAARRGVANDARRKLIAERAKTLASGAFEDSNTAKAAAEKHFLGVSLSCSPADDADTSQATGTCVDVARAPNGQEMSVVCIIDAVRHTRTKKGKNPGAAMCFLTVSDSTYAMEQVVVFPDAYEELKAYCKENNIVLVRGLKRDGSFIVQKIKKLI